jgi:hypothetical protein
MVSEKVIRAALELVMFALVLGVGFRAVDHLDDLGARGALGFLTLPTAIGAVAAVEYIWGNTQ